jgi:predicted DsbA family dithiol-disulfide isomerase
MTKFIIEIYSDTLCPWCYIGKKFLDSAITTYTTQHPDTEFELTWRPFLLHPKARASGKPEVSNANTGVPRWGVLAELDP